MPSQTIAPAERRTEFAAADHDTVLRVTVDDGTGFPTAAHLASQAGLAPTTRRPPRD
ncbi:hypothetical protein [Streptomyces sp. NPDC001100]